ncbi:ABC transporter permease [Halorientalis halophila]|uniref:ABC transporter permease n=1 Tax=Halorientalis halophila TaxID=3108499 RepID=UPI0030085C0D
MTREGSRLRRLRGVLGIAAYRVVGRLTGAASRRVLIAVVGVGFAVGLMVAVTGVALGLATPATVESEGVDYWIVPSDGAASAITVEVGQPQLGDVHRTRERLLADDRIDAVTPVLPRLVSVESDAGSEYALAVGLIPGERTETVAGVNTSQLTPGDPHYANGSYDGPRTDEVVLSAAAAGLLDASAGDRVRVRARGEARNVTVVGVDGATDPGSEQLPVVAMHLSELQSLTGTTGSDQASQILVSTSDPSVRSQLEGVYPDTTVVAKEGFASRPPTDDLSLAVAVAAFVTALVVGVLFVGTMMGLEVTADRRQLAVFSVVGYSARSRSLLVAGEVLCVAVCGGLVGLVLGLGGMALVDAVAAWQFGVDSVTAFHPLLLGYGLAVAILIGLLAAPYPAWLDRRSSVGEVLRR